MKSIIKILSFVSFLVVAEVTAQETTFPGDTTITLENSSFKKEFFFVVKKTDKYYMHRLNAKTSTGYISVEFRNSKNRRMGGFSLNGKNGAKGNAEDIFDNPSGTWKVIVEAREVTGYVKIKVMLDD